MVSYIPGCSTDTDEFEKLKALLDKIAEQRCHGTLNINNPTTTCIIVGKTSGDGGLY